MTVLLYDAETTGIPFYGDGHPAEADYQPRMCALAMALLEEDGNVMERFSSLIKPVGWPLDNELFVNNMEQAREKSHGLTFDRLEAEGAPIETVREAWAGLYGKATYLCGYNTWFDHKIVRGEWKRLGHPIPFQDKQGICLMKAARPLCGLPKNPKLAEAVRILLDIEHDKAHDATGDVDVSIDLYRYFYERDLIVPEDQPAAKGKAP